MAFERFYVNNREVGETLVEQSAQLELPLPEWTPRQYIDPYRQFPQIRRFKPAETIEWKDLVFVDGDVGLPNENINEHWSDFLALIEFLWIVWTPPNGRVILMENRPGWLAATALFPSIEFVKIGPRKSRDKNVLMWDNLDDALKKWPRAFVLGGEIDKTQGRFALYDLDFERGPDGTLLRKIWSDGFYLIAQGTGLHNYENAFGKTRLKESFSDSTNLGLGIVGWREAASAKILEYYLRKVGYKADKERMRKMDQYMRKI